MSLTKDVAWVAQKSSNGDFSSSFYGLFSPFPDSPSRLTSFVSNVEIGFSSGGLVVLTSGSGYDLVIDCTDAPPSRYLLNDAALHAARPLIAASAVG